MGFNMCGIFCSIPCSNLQVKKNHQLNLINPRLLELLKNRGPDKFSIIQSEANMVFAGFVLWQQGKYGSLQPIEEQDYITLLNGDINGIQDVDVNGISDSMWISKKLSSCKNEKDIRKLFQVLKGPFSIIFYNKSTECLYFARDALGRNSLLFERDSWNLRILSTSFIPNQHKDKMCVEIPPLGLYKININNLDNLILFPWTQSGNRSTASEFGKSIKMSIVVKDIIEPEWLYTSTGNMGGNYDFYNIIQNGCISPENLFPGLIKNEEVFENIKKFLELLQISVKTRVECTPKYCTDCITKLNRRCHHSKLAVLFSGGIDCTILAVLADKFADKKDSIDLINVAFGAKNSSAENWNVPDRCTARVSLSELEKLCPNRNWKFIEVNISRQELQNELSKHIRDLIYPLKTVLDESIGCAFWFASKGLGTCKGMSHKSSSRVIIVGSGADELFGGYTRHRNSYNRSKGSHEEKLDQVRAELEKDWERIPSRNLGRDDRVIGDSCKTTRTPFIEENVVRFARSLTSSQRCCFLLDHGIGDKLFLRLCGYQLGLRAAIRLRKRAIQFGSRIADKNQNGNDLSMFL